MKMKKLGLSKSSEAVQWTLCRLNVGLKWLKHYTKNFLSSFTMLSSCFRFDRSASKASTSNHFNSNCHVLKFWFVEIFAFLRKTNFFFFFFLSSGFCSKEAKTEARSWTSFRRAVRRLHSDTNGREKRESACVHAKLSLRERERERQRERERERKRERERISFFVICWSCEPSHRQHLVSFFLSSAAAVSQFYAKSNCLRPMRRFTWKESNCDKLKGNGRSGW